MSSLTENERGSIRLQWNADSRNYALVVAPSWMEDGTSWLTLDTGETMTTLRLPSEAVVRKLAELFDRRAEQQQEARLEAENEAEQEYRMELYLDEETMRFENGTLP
jgi:hypothetical protein